MTENKLNKDGLTEAEFLASYKPGDYDRPSVTVDNLIFTIDHDELKILLIKRKNHPYIGTWALPGGFVNIDESLDDAAIRELKEETNVENIYMEQLYTFGKPQRDPRMRVITAAYMALVPKSGLHPIAGDDAEDIAWFSVKTEAYQLILRNVELDITIAYQVNTKYKQAGVLKKAFSTVTPIETYENRLAFDHAEEINMALSRLRGKLEYTPIAFNLLEEEFTFPELQKLYEIILGKELYKATFRKKMESQVEALGKKKHVAGVRRDAELYRYKGERE